ncbi:MAG: hypothetical protein US11_C0007G0020 [Candidatus Roizmanbacteria bacterium GW2011_GWA2_36_23]|uniref:Uncharacterized protein n=1 Tax=Candidatus Roizmanbacteria bacterium GW2011_GWA2_36_23 TaxID=1618480 RepID=A0A0G0E7Q0_9BACT|nr:MAG: hypothetical protein US11_C0007G0020 [Candidatus Roizmanbacteria bacterium GW2011_GWA2_36_23]
MDNLNKTISFVLGLVVVLVFLAVITGRLNLRDRLQFLPGRGVSPTAVLTKTITPTKSPATTSIIKVTPAQKGGNNSTYNKYQTSTTKGGTPSSIPATGSPTILFPLLFSGIAGGWYLKKISAKK